MPEIHAAKGIRILSPSGALLRCLVFAAVLSQNAWSSTLGGKPTVVLQASKTSIIFPCPPGSRSTVNWCPSEPDFEVRLTSTARDVPRQSVYAYTVGVGRIIGEGASVTWNLNGVPPGTYTALVEVRDGKKRRAGSSVAVTLSPCPHCLTCDGLCPQVMVNCYEEVKAGTPITCKVLLNPPSDGITFKWTARSSRGDDLSSTLTSRNAYVSVPTNDLAGQTVYVKVEVEGLDPSCSRTASSPTRIRP